MLSWSMLSYYLCEFPSLPTSPSSFVLCSSLFALFTSHSLPLQNLHPSQFLPLQSLLLCQSLEFNLRFDLSP
ncbi:hypothetical protein BS50DRAFT_34745 [Corynespora cassiicola Philippines]|uniref:Uncharacterized protein n=1 Tax=Corynespora cassiicola Philippines TaxID=1448308 RepID=A0A2T2PC19_CORCC|nr:hypothetical protein BS50DRAFT_34745 [Corynespora cassiicola Philippines]